jgi:polysaccharide biosynthesis/export protein
MKAILLLSKGLMIAICAGSVAMSAFGQTTAKATDTKGKSSKDKGAEKTVPLPAPSSAADGEADDPKAVEDAILPYYDNYLREYRLGPSDVISVEVFGQCPDYCKTGITIPPNARISYPLVRDGVFVAGRTVDQVAAEITQKLDEFIIDPKVTVTLDKANATRYSVMGNVAVPGVRVMDRKVSVYEAILEAGGVTKNGDKKKIALVSYTNDGRLSKRIVSLADMEAGKAEMVFLNPGDQVFVTGKGFSIDKVFDILGKASMVRYMMGSPF